MIEKHDRKNYINTQNGISSNQGGMKRKKLLVTVQQDHIEYSRFAIFIACCYALFLAFTISVYASNAQFLGDLAPALKYYKSAAESSSALSELSALRILIDESMILS